MKKWKSKLMLVMGFALIAATPPARSQNNSELQGNYAFSFTGMTTGDGSASTPFGAVGRFTADGPGNLLNCELDSNCLGIRLGGVEKSVALEFSGILSICKDNS